MYESFVEWVQMILNEGYQVSRGQWIDEPGLAKVWIAAVHQAGGPSIDVDDRRPTYRVVLLGPRGSRGAASSVQADAELLIEKALCGSTPCGAASVRVVGEPVGPAYTVENRAWVSINMQITH